MITYTIGSICPSANFPHEKILTVIKEVTISQELLGEKADCRAGAGHTQDEPAAPCYARR